MENAPPRGSPWLEYALVASPWPDDRDAALLLFDHLTEPHLIVEPSFGLSGAARFDIDVRGDDHWLTETWSKLFQPNLAALVHDVLAIADRHLRRAHQLLIAAGAASSGWDPVSFGRSSIVAHPQDRYADDIGIVIDADIVVQDWIARSCAVGFDGWVYWGYLRAPLDDATWALTDSDVMQATLAPAGRPDPCVPTLTDPDLAAGRPVSASRSLPEEPPEAAVDGSPGTQWGSGADAPSGSRSTSAG